MILQNSRTIPGQKALFSRTKVKFFQVCANPVRACLIYARHIKPQIQFVDIYCGHGMPLNVFIPCDLDLRSQFLKKCTHSRSPILFMVAFHIWYVDTSWTWRVTKCFQVTVTLTSGFSCSKVELRAFLYII